MSGSGTRHPCHRRSQVGIRISRGLPSAPPRSILPARLNTSPDIHAFFDDELWQERFDDECLQAGQRLRPKVRELIAEWPDEDNFTLRAEVAGEPCEVVMWPSGGEWDFESTCSCEVRTFCPHAAALFEEAAKPKNLPRLLDGKPVRSSSPVLPGTAGLQTGSNGSQPPP